MCYDIEANVFSFNLTSMILNIKYIPPIDEQIATIVHYPHRYTLKLPKDLPKIV